MPHYFGKNKEEIAKGTCVEDLKYPLLYAVPTLSQYKFYNKAIR